VNVNLLIDAIVRQTTVLVAQIATAAGARAQLAHTANQVFLDLVHELKDQGLGNKVIAEMFGLNLRTYHNKIARLAESSTERGRSLWEALLAYVEERGSATRSDVLNRFRGDEEAIVRGAQRSRGRRDALPRRPRRSDHLPCRYGRRRASCRRPRRSARR
jgi:hypothetical protein